MMMMMMLMMMILMRMMQTLASFWWWVSRCRPRPLVLPLVHGNSFRHVLQEALPLGSFSKYSQTRLWCFIASMKSYRGMSTIQLQYIKFNFHFCPTCLKIVLCWEQSLQKSSESESSVMVVGKCEWTTYMPYGGGRNNTDTSKLLHKDFSKNMWIIISFFSETRSRFL